MSEHLQFLAQHGYAVLFAWVLAEQAGMPIPAIPILLAAGALAASGDLALVPAILLAILGAMAADFTWYQFGKHRGMSVLSLLCRVSLEPDSCVRQTQTAFSKQGVRSLLIAKFIPGLNTAAPPLAAIIGVSVPKFLLYDFLGCLIWAGGFIILGYVFDKQLDEIIHAIEGVGGSLATTLIFALALYIVYKFLKRQLFLRELRVLRLQPAQLKELLDSGAQVVVVDLRHPADYANEPRSIIGAIRMSPQEIEEKHEQIPRGQDVILYCT
jgi:membrane protein DedA with SNARE-associated domain